MAVIAKQRYKLDIAPSGGWVIVYASQHDNGAREIEFEITNQGNAYSIPASINISVQGVKSNKGYFSHSCSYSGNVVTMALADDMTDVIGKAICVLKFTNSSQQKLATAKFILNVDSDSSSEGIIIDTEAEEIFNQMLDEIRAQAASISADIAELQSMVGSPLVASTVSAMTDHNKIYVYTGSESGYTNGNWYYWNGSAWTSGGVYNAVAFETDTTFTQSGQPADAATVGAKAMLPRGTIASNTDIDTIKTLGAFTVSKLSVARTLVHWPCTGLTTENAVAGSLIVFAHRESNSGASYGIVQVAVSPDQMWYREYRNSTWSDWAFVINNKYMDSIPTANSNYPVKSSGIYNAIKAIEEQIVPEDKNVKMARIYGTKFYGHLFIDGIARDATPIIPSESLTEIQLSKRLGFTIVEGHLKKTADGRYIVMHGVSGNIGYELITVNNGEFTPDILISSLTFDEIRTGYVYRSTEQKFMTPVVSAEEWLTACKIAGMTPLVMCEDDDAVNLVKSYCGEDFILYNGTRGQHSGIMFIYRSSLGDTVADTKSTIDSIYEEIGLPLIIEAFTITQYTDAELSEIVQYAHSKGILFGTANCYYNVASSRIIRAQICGVDIAASGWEVPAFENGNLLNLSSDFDFSEYISAGTESNGVLQLTSGQTVTIGTQQSVQLGKGIVKIVYSGRITIDIGRYWKYGNTTGKRYDSDGTQELVFSTYYLDEEPTFLITALSATIIKSLVFKSSRC